MIKQTHAELAEGSAAKQQLANSTQKGRPLTWMETAGYLLPVAIGGLAAHQMRRENRADRALAGQLHSNQVNANVLWAARRHQQAIATGFAAQQRNRIPRVAAVGGA